MLWGKYLWTFIGLLWKKTAFVSWVDLVYSISIGCISFNSIESFLLFRFLQAFGGCVAAVAVLAMVRDFFPVNEGARIISLLILILGVSPLLAPTAGSFIIASGSWRLIFILLAVIVIAILPVIIFFLPEGHPPDKAVSLKPKPIFKNFKRILSEPLFYVYALAGSFSYFFKCSQMIAYDFKL